jgi:hypothetical protein
MRTTTRGSLVGIAALFVLACTSDAVLLPPNFNASQVTHIMVKAGVTTGLTVRPLAGVQGGPVPTVTGDGDLTSFFVDVGVDVFRMPGGYLCDYALGSVFPDREAPVGAPESYEFAALDKLFKGTSITEGFKPRVVVYQAFYDIDEDENCEVDANGVHTGQPPEDIVQWSNVVTNVLRHLNADLLISIKPEHAPWIPDALDARVRYVEFVSRPMERGGYTDVADVLSDLGTFASAVKAAFPNANDGPRMHVVMPTMAIQDTENFSAHPLVALMDGLVATGVQDSVDVLSFAYEGSSVVQGREVAIRLRQSLDERGLDHIALWAGEYMPGGVLPKASDEDAVALWSARSGALSNALRIAWQGTLDEAIYARGDRRNLCLGTTCDALDVEESALWSGTGAWRPAGVGWIPWQYLSGREAVDASISNEQATTATWVLATKDQEGCAGAGNSGCGRVYVLIAQAGDPGGTESVSYLVKVAGLEAVAGSAKIVQVDRLSVTKDSTVPKLVDSHTISLTDGVLTLSLDTTSPVTEFLLIKKGE